MPQWPRMSLARVPPFDACSRRVIVRNMEDMNAKALLIPGLAAKHLGAERIIVMSRHEPRQKLELGATDIVEERGDEGAARIKDLTGSLGAHSTIEAVGTPKSVLQATARSSAGGGGLGRRAFLRSLGRASAGVAALGTGAVGLGVGFGLGGCASDDPRSPDEVPRPAGVPMQPPDLDAMFQPGVRYRFDEDIGGGEAVIEVDDLDDLYLPTGRLVAADPFWVGIGDDAAYTVTVPPGRYHVEVSFARSDPPDPDALIPRLGAAARLKIRDEPAAAWEMALRPGEDVVDLGSDEFYGFDVDTGTGAFLDESAIAPLRRRVERIDRGGPEAVEEDEMTRAAIDGEAFNLVLDQATGLNVVVFGCGMGDGAYPVWIGCNSSGDPTCFIADLEILSHTSGPITH
jgi:hypothetical protein